MHSGHTVEEDRNRASLLSLLYRVGSFNRVVSDRFARNVPEQNQLSISMLQAWKSAQSHHIWPGCEGQSE
jgi:hypothetical protein